MAFWSKMWQLDAKIRRLVGLFILTPFCLLALPAGVFVLWQSTGDCLRLERQHIATRAVVQTVSQTGGRLNRHAVTAIFRAEDGKSYVSKATYGIEGSKHVRPRMSLGVIYEWGNPSNNAPLTGPCTSTGSRREDLPWDHGEPCNRSCARVSIGLHRAFPPHLAPQVHNAGVGVVS